MLTISLILLAISSGGAAVWLNRQAAAEATGTKTIALSSLFIALAAMAQVVIPADGSDLHTLRQMLENLAYFAGLPLIATAMILITLKQSWSKPAWGRWLIGLFAFFELLRRMQYGQEYSQFIALLCAGALVFAAIRIAQPANRPMLLTGSLVSAAGLALFSQGSLQPELADNAFYSLCLAIGLPLVFLGIAQKKKGI